MSLPIKQNKPRTALVMAGGTGGHIFPGLAVAQELRARGWNVHWLGAPGSMESRIVPPQGFALELIEFGGVRGKGAKTLLQLPFKLAKAFSQARGVIKRVQPDVVIGLGGYLTVPGGLMAAMSGVPVVLHEQNSVAGMANKVVAKVAKRVFTAFPKVFAKGEWVGNPLRQPFLEQGAPAQRFAGRTGPLKLLVVGGSLGAKALNEIVPKALALIPVSEPVAAAVLHHEGILGELLILTKACESHDQDQFDRSASSLELEPQHINSAHLQALSWTECLAH